MKRDQERWKLNEGKEECARMRDWGKWGDRFMPS